MTPAQRSHLRTLYDCCQVVQVLGLSASGWPVVRRVDHRADEDPAKDVTYAIAPSGVGVDDVEVSIPLDDERVYELDPDDFTLLIGV